MIEFVENIEKYTKDVDRQAFLSNRMLIDAVARNFEILGEASTHIPETVKSKYPDVPWTEMRGLRIILAHNYMGADFSVLWDTSCDHLALLKARLLEIKNVERETE